MGAQHLERMGGERRRGKKSRSPEAVHPAQGLDRRHVHSRSAQYPQPALRTAQTQNAALQSQKQHRERIVYETILICAALMLLGAWLDCACAPRQMREFAQQKRILRQENELDAMRRKEQHLRTTFFRQLNSRFIAQVREGGESRKCRIAGRRLEDDLHPCRRRIRQFHGPFRGQFPALNEEDIRYCCMVRMHLSQAEIASVVCLEKDSVKKRLKRIRTEKLALAKGSTLRRSSRGCKIYPRLLPPTKWKQQAVSLLKNALHCDIPLQTSGNSRGGV